nr:MAG TPA: AAA domain protein [Caudoviricetes sp.]
MTESGDLFQCQAVMRLRPAWFIQRLPCRAAGGVAPLSARRIPTPGASQGGSGKTAVSLSAGVEYIPHIHFLQTRVNIYLYIYTTPTSGRGSARS